MNITLIGMKHCGKSTLGAALARRRGCRFHDADRMLEDRHARHTDQRQSVREIFAERGEEYFRQLELEVVGELQHLLRDSTEPHVIALGGRTPLNARVDQLLGPLSRIVYLEVAPDEMFARVERSGLPPFIDQDNPREHFLALYRERDPRYRDAADLTVNLDGLDPEAALEKLCHALAASDDDPRPPHR